MACGHASECACCGMLMVFWAPLVFRVPSGPAAREIATREPTARSGRSRSPPWPSGPSGTLHTGGACVAVCGWVRRLEARPGPAAAHGHRRLALRALRHPPHRRRLCRCVWLGASSRSAPVPSVPSGTLHTGGACVAVCGWVRRLEARPGLAAAHGHRSPRVPQPGPAGLAVLSMLVVQTPFGGGEIAVRGGVMPKVQTTSAKNAENGLLWAKWSAFWARRYRS